VGGHERGSKEVASSVEVGLSLPFVRSYLGVRERPLAGDDVSFGLSLLLLSLVRRTQPREQEHLIPRGGFDL
jgi:hypothetical protein